MIAAVLRRFRARRRAVCAECGVDQRGEAPMVTDRDRAVVAWVAVIGNGQCPERDDQIRARAHGRLPAFGAARRPRPAHALATGVPRAGAVHGDEGRAGVGPGGLVATTRYWALCACLAVELGRGERCAVWGSRDDAPPSSRPTGAGRECPARRSAGIDRNVLAAGRDHRGRTVRIPAGTTSGRHALVVGATGSGKTVTHA